MAKLVVVLHCITQKRNIEVVRYFDRQCGRQLSSQHCELDGASGNGTAHPTPPWPLRIPPG